MLNIDAVQIYPQNANYVWILSHPAHKGVVIFDPGSLPEIVDYLEQNNKKIDSIFITHSHWDHITDLPKTIEDRSLWQHPDQIRVVGPSLIEGVTEPIKDGQSVPLWRTEASSSEPAISSPAITCEALHTPGHLPEHLAYLVAGQSLIKTDGKTFPTTPALFCGDVLFSGGCGRVFDGTHAELLGSLKRLAQLQPDTLIFCSHEYTLANLEFAKHIDPSNPALAGYFEQVESLRKSNRITLPSNLAREVEINPFLRCHTDAIRAGVQRQLPDCKANELAIFTALRTLKNNN